MLGVRRHHCGIRRNGGATHARSDAGLGDVHGRPDANPGAIGDTAGARSNGHAERGNGHEPADACPGNAAPHAAPHAAPSRRASDGGDGAALRFDAAGRGHTAQRDAHGGPGCRQLHDASNSVPGARRSHARAHADRAAESGLREDRDVRGANARCAEHLLGGYGRLDNGWLGYGRVGHTAGVADATSDDQPLSQG